MRIERHALCLATTVLAAAGCVFCQCTQSSPSAAHDALATSDAIADASDDAFDTTGLEPGACVPGEAVLVGAAPNARDLGGIALADGDRVACGDIFRGGPLSGLGDAGCAELARRGVATVIDLRQPAERTTLPAAACVAAQAEVALAPMPIPYTLDGAAYLADLDAADAMRAAFAALGDEARYPIYFHCTYGRDRTGVLAAVVLLTLGASRDAVVADYQRSHDSGLTTYPAALGAVLDAIDQRGGVAAYLAASGVTPEQIATLRRHVARGPPRRP